MKSEFTERHALALAVQEAQRSPCAKSKRGVVIFHRAYGLLARGHNAPPPGFSCGRSEACRQACGKLCRHAEVVALHKLRVRTLARLELLHVKAVGGQGVPSGPPSCWQCSREIVSSGIERVWLLRDGLGDAPELVSYSAREFHILTLQHNDLPVISDARHD